MFSFLRNQVDKLTDTTSEVFENYVNLAKVSVNEKLAKLLSSLIIGGVLFAIMFLAFGFLSVALAIWIGEAMGNIKAGFFLLSGFLALLLLLFFIFRKRIVVFIRNRIVAVLYSDHNSNKNDKD